MPLKPVSLYYNYLNEDGSDYIEYSEDNATYKTAVEYFDRYPWAQELEAFEKYDESGGMNIYKGDPSNIYAVLNIYVVEKDKVSIAFDVRAKKGFLGLFGNVKVSKDIGYISFNEAKQVIRDVYELDEDQLCTKYA